MTITHRRADARRQHRRGTGRARTTHRTVTTRQTRRAGRELQPIQPLAVVGSSTFSRRPKAEGEFRQSGKPRQVECPEGEAAIDLYGVHRLAVGVSKTHIFPVPNIFSRGDDAEST
jgi:hypothetical protein